MGVGGKFWDLLKPYVRHEGFDYLRNKRVAVDLSFWVVQHETAIKAYVRNPHLRLLFFRTINLFSKLGAYPVFVVDGTPSPLKSKARILRFFQLSGVDMSSFPMAEEGVSVERNRMFVKCVQDCVELIELLGMPVLKAKGEAEALCAQLNREGYVDACLTADSDAFLYGAKCVIKCLRPNTKEPFECYYMSDIEAGLGLKNKHLIAISLLVGCDHDLNGVPGIGLDTALRLVQCFNEDEILDRLHELGRGDTCSIQVGAESSQNRKFSHCSHCGHPGSKRDHLKFGCEYCSTRSNNSCVQKPVGFICDCSSCNMYRKGKQKKKHDNWKIRVCNKIAMKQNFPNDEIIEMYTKNNHASSTVSDFSCLAWESPKTEILVDFLGYHLQWGPSYIRQRMFTMMTTIFLREMTSNATDPLLLGQYEFDSVLRVKMRLGHQFFVVKWNKAANFIGTLSTKQTNIIEKVVIDRGHKELIEIDDDDDLVDLLDEPDSLTVVDDGDSGCFLLTDEDMELVKSAFPKKVDVYRQEQLQQLKESRKKRKPVSKMSPKNSEASSCSTSLVQRNITEFYRCVNNKKRKVSTPSFSKSVRRRLLFDS